MPIDQHLTLHRVPRSQFIEHCREVLASNERSVVVTWHHDGEAFLQSITEIYTDLDGTLLTPGATAVPAEVVHLLLLLQAEGVSTCFVTGKPLTEIVLMFESLPVELRVRALYEKGAYFAERLEDGTLKATQLLADPNRLPSLADDASTVRRHLYQGGLWWELLHKAFGVKVVPAGDGQHRAVISIDLLKSDSSFNFRDSGTRDQIKITEETIVLAVMSEIDRLLDESGLAAYRGTRVVNVGNANLEISPLIIEKDTAIKAVANLRGANGVLVMGDGGNDRRMFGLREEYGNVRVGVVFHESTPPDVLTRADFVVPQMMNGGTLLRKIVSLKQSVAARPAARSVPAVTRSGS